MHIAFYITPTSTYKSTSASVPPWVEELYLLSLVSQYQNMSVVKFLFITHKHNVPTDSQYSRIMSKHSFCNY